MVAKLLAKGEPPPQYGNDDNEFIVELHHGGTFVGEGLNRAYLDEKINWFDHVEVDTWSPLWFEDFAYRLHYPKNSAMKVYWLLPGKTLADGLRVIVDDTDTIVMSSMLHTVKNFVVYLDHDDDISGLNWDDIVSNPIATLPKVMSPHKVQYVPRKEGEKLPEWYADLKKAGEHGASSVETDSDLDSDFVDSDYEVDADDDNLFMNNVDDEVTDGGGATRKLFSVPSLEKDAEELSSDEEDLQLPESDGEGEGRLRFSSFRKQDMNNPVFKVGMLFESVELLRKAITEYSLKERVQIKRTRNEKKRLEAYCDEGCPWFLYASVDNRAHGMVIKSYIGTHTCQRKWELKMCTSKWLADKYIEAFRADQKMTITNFQRTVQKDWNITPSRSQVARARRLAMKKVHGDEAEQYRYLWDYGQEVRRSNPHSTFLLRLDGNIFSTLYMSLDACKRGFLFACRPIICLDGCHIKTKYGGQILTAVGIDPNDCIFPIAIGIVEVECKKSWKWFLQILKEYLGIENSYPWTFMTDKQKGLIPAVQEVFPESEHRFCVRHLYSNFQQHFKGENLKNQLWCCARSSSVVQFNRNMDKLKVIDNLAHAWLEKMPPQTWCRAFFSSFPKCDVLLNNSCEVFNSYILFARELPILTMLETIKSQLMTRFYTKGKEVGTQWDGVICPKIKKKVMRNTEWSNTCYAMPSGHGIFQVQDRDHTYIVDMNLKKCDCRRWDLTGIPCSHAISCLRHERISPETVVAECYSSIAYCTAYSGVIMPCRDKSEWEKVHASEILPPVYEKKVGRPPKARRKQPHEVDGRYGPKLSKHGITIHCGYCGGEGHNRATCTLRKAGHPPQRTPTTASAKDQVQQQPPTEDMDDEGPIVSQVSMHYNESDGPMMSQLSMTMISQLTQEASQTREVDHGPLPDSVFIATNQPETRPIVPTTATISLKRKGAPAKKAPPLKKSTEAGKKAGGKKTGSGN